MHGTWQCFSALRRRNKRPDHSQVLIDLARLSVLSQQPSQHPLSPHPHDLRRHARLTRTLPLSRAGVTSLALRCERIAGACARVDGGGLDDHAAVLDELLDVCARVGIPDFGLLSGVEPDFALTDARDGGGEPLLRTKIDCGKRSVCGRFKPNCRDSPIGDVCRQRFVRFGMKASGGRAYLGLEVVVDASPIGGSARLIHCGAMPLRPEPYFLTAYM